MTWWRRRRPETRQPTVGASVYRRRDRVFVLPLYDIYTAGEPATQPADVSPARLGELVLGAIELSRTESVDGPDLAPLLRAAGIRGYGAFMKGAELAEVTVDGEVVTVTRMRNMGPRGGFEFTNATQELTAHDAAALGAAVLAALGPEGTVPARAADDEPDPDVTHDEIAATLEWIVAALESVGYRADFEPASLREIDRFFDEQAELLSEDVGVRLFGLGVYVGEVIRRAAGGEWGGGGEVDLRLELADGSTMWPVQRVMKRYELGDEESLAAYGAALGA